MVNDASCCSESTSLAPTLRAVLSGDTAALVVQWLDRIEDLAAALASVAPLYSKDLHDAIMSRAREIVVKAPLWSAVSNFCEDFLWPSTVAAANWHVHPYFGAMRAPQVCRVAGSGTCSHGLCQKQEAPKEGVLELLAALASGSNSNSVVVAALECAARLNGALGRNETALQLWSDAAEAGSARAQLDLGVRRYNTGTASTVYCQPGSDPSPVVESAAGAEKLLRAAASNPALPSLGLEGRVIKARACMILGMMALDGDGSTQDDKAAFIYFNRAQSAAKPDRDDAALSEGSEGSAESGDEDVPRVMKYWDRAHSFGRAEYQRRMRQSLLDVEADAQESMANMEGYMFFRNGRP